TKPPAFLYVDVHPSAPNAEMVGGRFRAGSRFQASGYTMLDLISRAYNLPWERIAGGPSWIGTDRFDLIAAIPPGVPASASLPMIQAVLAERFQFKVHDETRPVPAYALISGRQPRLKDSTGGESRCQYKRDRSTITLDCTNMPMNQFVRELKDYAQEFFDRPLGDKTNLTGRYDFSLTWTQRDQVRVRNAEGELNGTTPQTALQKQLGLECGARPEPMEVLVIDSVNRVPTPNAPGVVEALNNSTYTHFDVAEVRSHKEEAGFKYDDQETQIIYFGFILPAFINMAWNTPPQKRQVIGPDWIKTEKFDIIAKPANRTAWENMQLTGEPAEASGRQHTEIQQRQERASATSPPKRRTEDEAPKTVAGVTGPVGVPAMCRASNRPFGECAQLETVGHNPRPAFHGSDRAGDGGPKLPRSRLQANYTAYTA